MSLLLEQAIVLRQSGIVDAGNARIDHLPDHLDVELDDRAGENDKGLLDEKHLGPLRHLPDDDGRADILQRDLCGAKVELFLDPQKAAHGQDIVAQLQVQLVFVVVAAEQQIRSQRPVPDQGGIGPEIGDPSPDGQEPAGLGKIQRFALEKVRSLLRRLEGCQGPQEKVRIVDPVGMKAEGIARRKREGKLLQSLSPARGGVRVLSQFDNRHIQPTGRRRQRE